VTVVDTKQRLGSQEGYRGLLDRMGASRLVDGECVQTNDIELRMATSYGTQLGPPQQQPEPRRLKLPHTFALSSGCIPRLNDSYQVEKV
jgi:hypothetical protein